MKLICILFGGAIAAVIIAIIIQKINETTIADPLRDFIHTGSSVHCIGYNNSDRRCYFQNLCFHPNTSMYFFLHGPGTTIQGFDPSDRINLALVDLSSVNDHNMMHFHYTDIILKAVSVEMLGKIQFHKQSYFIMNRFNPDNLMHVFHDDLLPLYLTFLNECRGDLENCIDQPIVIFNEKRPPGEYFILYKTLSKSYIFVEDLNCDYLHCFKSARVGLDKRSTWYQYGFTNPQGPLKKEHGITGDEIRAFVSFLQRKLGVAVTRNYNLILMIYRKKTRRILNINELSETVEAFTGKDVRIVSIEDVGVTEVLKLVSQASILISVHGSALILSLFLRPRSVLIELFPYGIKAKYYTPYKTLANIKNMKILYYPWENTIENNTVTHPDWPKKFGGLHHLPKSTRKSIISSTEVPLHLCCDSPEWLYRIYQDTFVDSNSFMAVFQKAWFDQRSLMAAEKNGNMPHDPQCGRINKIHCNTVANGQKTSICAWWDPPFNLDYLENISDVTYEVWIQLFHQNRNTHAYYVKDLHYCFGPYEKDVQVYVWIRCLLENKPGPFNLIPKLCPP